MKKLNASKKIGACEIDVSFPYAGACIVKLTGEFDFYAYKESVDFMNNFFTDEKKVILDMRGLEYMDSSGIKLVDSLVRKFSFENIAIYGMKQNVRRIFEVVGIKNELVELTDADQFDGWFNEQQKAA